MSQPSKHTHAFVCRLCDFLIPHRPLTGRAYRSRLPATAFRTFTSTRRHPASKPRNTSIGTAHVPQSTAQRKNPTGGPILKPSSSVELEASWHRLKETCDALLSLDRAPSEKEILHALNICRSMVKLLVMDTVSSSPQRKDNAASALLSLDVEPQATKVSQGPVPAMQKRINELSRLAYDVLKTPSVFISPKILDSYVDIQASLGKPETFGEVFTMYAHKPLPQEGTPLRYAKANPNKLSNAVNVAVADRALQAAAAARQMLVAMDIVESTYSTAAFHRSKFVRKALLPIGAIAAVPVTTYTLASQIAHLQTTMDSEMATNVAFAGMLAYTFFTGTVGWVALSTANDQMERVTWAPGLPLRERWIREEERAAVDKIAQAWGFCETWKRGEEEGHDWDMLREWIGQRGMILDRVELMEGME